MQPVFAPWLGTAGGKVQTIAKDHDVFGDGSVLIKATPGHTPGHTSLLVRLPQTGDVLLTGDLYHFQEQAFAHAVPGYNFSRVQTLASMARFDETARNLNAKVIIQHDSRHVGRLGGMEPVSLGIPSEADYVRAYCRRTGRDSIPGYDFYIAFNLFRLAAIIHGIKGRLIRGTAASANARSRVEALPTVTALAREAMEMCLAG